MNNMNDDRENPSSLTEKQDSEDSSLMEELTKLIKQDQEKGKTAWKIGEGLSKLKSKNLPEFESVISEKWGISTAQAERRIGINSAIKNLDLITPKMGITHLEQVIRLGDENAIETVLKYLAQLEDKNSKTLPYNEKIIASVVSHYNQYLRKKEELNNQGSKDNENLFSSYKSKENKNQESSKDISFPFKDYFDDEISDYKSQSERKKNERADIWGQDIKTSYFPEIENIYSKQPIDEQGLVGLFCTIFPIIKNKGLDIKCLDYLNFLEIPKKYQYPLEFFKIKGIRTRFPDAIIEFYVCNRQLEKIVIDIFVEFEFASFNYIRHKHYESQEKCHLIVCWKHEELSKWENWRKLYYKKNKPLPFILSVEKVLETGEINLINLNQ
jgi:hypothetical protein